MPTLAPVLSPPELVIAGAGAVDVVATAEAEEELVAAMDEVEEGADVVEDEVVEVDVDEGDTFESITKPRLWSWPSTNPLISEVSAPVGSLMIRTKFGLSDIWSSLMLSSSPIFQVYDPVFSTSAGLGQRC
ncbi:uncharacterized protein Z518_01643 [Rhinocladiella mackenziei CBS 650.93]|uniref:Rhinocladiella mackenziei CBS 650.93 unplaced genomic scaffold supercont1.1, whole genome shotgun sequence n=1 Tax=Rhinocladiella mackenziei CBS 650.93 TaxID=1442369 RepID=A0A0D2IX37_9EURO|nr:uncharacterized protein Z518_01643 [Rhinocladiella mackenziei CBS 650.93]KIX10559.1 hypothetical protein Z518_01643 [Rhinocladiella mackenziei CBS 650.93]